MRSCRVELYYEDEKIEVSEFVTDFVYADRTKSDTGDELSVTFQDIAGLWRTNWLPDFGAKFNAIIKCENWFNPGDHFERDCGGFEIDQLSSSGKPSVFSISCVSVGIENSIRRQQNSDSRDNITIKDFIEEIAEKHDFELLWYSNYNPVLERWAWKGQSDIVVIREMCEYAGLMIKITGDKLIIFRAEEFDEKEAEITIKAVDDGVTSWDITSSSSDVYSACEVKYYDPERKEMIEYLYFPDGLSGIRQAAKPEKKNSPTEKPGTRTYIEDETRMVSYVEIPVPPVEPESEEDEEDPIYDPEVGQILKVNRRVGSLAEAELVAKSMLRKANMRQLQGSISFMGRPDLYSGLNIELKGFGRFIDSVKWQIEEVIHSVSGSGYITDISIRGVVGY